MWLFNVLFIIGQSSYAQNRIESIHKNIGQSSKIYLKPGLVSVLEMPQNIIEVRIGNPNDLKGVISQVSPKEITLFFKTSNASATNLILRSDRKVYVFDVIPSQNKHQDYVKISSGIGIVQNMSGANTVLESSVINLEKLPPANQNKILELSEKVSL